MDNHPISSDLIRGHIDTIILNMLIESDKFAQQISDAVEQKCNGEYKINQATLYSSLKRLEGLKFVSSYWYDSDVGRRKYFKLTQAGKDVVEKNLSDWAYSRNAIDKLLDCAPQIEYRTQIIEKPVEVIKEKIVEVPLSQLNTDNIDPENKLEKNEIKTEEKNDLNFRTVIDDLLSVNKTAEIVEAEKLEPLHTESVDIVIDEKLSLEETLDSTDYNAQKDNNNGKIDFGDITLKAAKEGYKVRISSKDCAVAKGTLLSNKLRFYSAIVLFVIMLAETLFFTIKFNGAFSSTFLTWFAIIGINLLFPIVSAIIYFKNPTKKTKNSSFLDNILTVGIIAFNLLLIVIAANLLSNVDFSNINLIILSFIIPCVIVLDMFIYYAIRFSFAKLKIFYKKD